MVAIGNDQQQQMLKLLRENYAVALPERLVVLQQYWQALLAAKTTEKRKDAGELLLREVHSLAGSAGTFGFPELGEQAKQLESFLHGCAPFGNLLLPAQQTQITARLVGLEQQAQSGPQEPPSPSVHNPSVPSLMPAQHGLENSRIFLLEDDALLAQEIAVQLGVFGWDVCIYTNATEAMTALQALAEQGSAQDLPAALIIDIVLPEGPLAGTTFIQRLHTLPLAHPPHIVISARWDLESRLAAARSGAAAYLVKPLDFVALAQHLDRVTSRTTLENPYRVLIVDDSQDVASHFTQVLKHAGMHVQAINDPLWLLDALAEHQPELVLMDLYMPGCNGIEAARMIRQDPQFLSLPIVFLSTETGLAQQQQAMQTGADDFLHKPISDSDLVLAVSVRIERFRALAALIRRDSLTGLLNHIAFKARLEAEVLRSQRQQSPLTVAMLDIDHFKKVNDTYGHPCGDRVIKALAHLLHKRLRKSDLIGRYGGEEFVLALPSTELEVAAKIVNELREQFEQLRYVSGAQEFSCTFSAGLAAYPSLSEVTSLIDRADEALYRAKHDGRNRVCQYVVQNECALSERV